MNNRQEELLKLKEYIDNVDKETTLLLQNLQWDQKHLLESPAMVSCKYVAEHRIPEHLEPAHEQQCYLRREGYSKEDVLLPDPINSNADTVVRLSKQDIIKIIHTAASMEPSFKRGTGAVEPLSAERLQQAYSADERRAIHDAVVAAAPACHDLTDLALVSSSGGPQASKAKSRAEILAELRDMKRRRTRYRVAAKTSNYSHVLHDVIKTQMELYAEAKGIFIKTEYGDKTFVSLNKSTVNENNATNIVIKQERMSPDADHRERSTSTDRRRHRTEYQDRETAPRKSRSNSSNNKYGDFSRDKHSHERWRYDYGYSKQETYHRAKDITNVGSYRTTSTITEVSSTSRQAGRYNDSDKKQYKYDDKNYTETSKSKYESSTKEHKRRSYKEDSLRNSKDDRKRRYDDYERSYKESSRYREEKHRRRYDDHVKEEKVEYCENSHEERKKRQRH